MGGARMETWAGARRLPATVAPPRHRCQSVVAPSLGVAKGDDVPG
jgi:hypothetical protein